MKPVQFSKNNKKPFCVEFCERIRSVDKVSSAPELGSGLLEIEPFDGLGDLIQEGVRYLFQEKLTTRFGLEPKDTIIEEILQSLVSITHTDSIPVENLLLTDGVSHGLTCIFEYCAQQGIGVLLPLPCYFGYELSALHCGVEIAGYYDAANASIHWLNTDIPVCLVVNTPDALTGSVLSMTQLQNLRDATGERLQLTVLDVICAMHGYTTSSEQQFRISNLWREPEGYPKIILLGVTKDLGLPGFRAGLMFGNTKKILSFCRDSIFARSFSSSIVVGLVMLVYLRLLEALDFADTNPSIQKKDLFSTGKLSPSQVFTGLDTSLTLRFLDHRNHLDTTFTNAFRTIANEFRHQLDLPEGRHQQVGYSMMAGFKNGTRGLENTIRASRSILEKRHLKISPSYMFGGTPQLWNALYPDQLHFRLNLSTPVEKLARQLHTTLAAFAG